MQITVYIRVDNGKSKFGKGNADPDYIIVICKFFAEAIAVGGRRQAENCRQKCWNTLIKRTHGP